MKYGFGVLLTSLQFALQRMGILKLAIFSQQGLRLDLGYYAGYYSVGAEKPEPIAS